MWQLVLKDLCFQINWISMCFYVICLYKYLSFLVDRFSFLATLAFYRINECACKINNYCFLLLVKA